MPCLERNKNKNIYLCNKTIDSNNRNIFANPIPFKLNLIPISSTGEIIAFGSEYISKLKIITTKEIASQFHNDDRCYIYNTIPSQYDKLCANADFKVNGNPLITLNTAVIYLERILNENS